MRCEKCNFECDSQDIFCRKCGTTVAQSEAEVSASSPLQVTTTAVEVIPAAPLTLARPNKLRWLNRALNSKPGKKLVRGAALVAVGVGLELVAQAFGSKPKRSLVQSNNSNQALAAQLPPPNNSRTTVIQTVTTQRTYTRTIIRRVK